VTASDVAAADEYRDLPSGRDPDSHLAARRSAARAFRPRRTLTAIVVAVLIAAVAGLIAADLISKYRASRPRTACGLVCRISAISA
jgi:1,4-dihydroxy-2-naphthoate octaprenyltransferase